MVNESFSSLQGANGWFGEDTPITTTCETWQNFEHTSRILEEVETHEYNDGQTIEYTKKYFYNNSNSLTYIENYRFQELGSKVIYFYNDQGLILEDRLLRNDEVVARTKYYYTYFD